MAGAVSSDTPRIPLDTPPSDSGPEERVQPQQTAETHSLRAGGGAAPRRAWYGGRAALVRRTVAGRGLKVVGAAGAEEVGELKEQSLAGRRWRQSGVLRVGAWEKAPSSGIWSGTGAAGDSPCSVSFPFPLQQRSLTCPGACKNSLLRSLASCSSVPILTLPWSEILERIT